MTTTAPLADEPPVDRAGAPRLLINFVEAEALFIAVRSLRGVAEVTRELLRHGVPVLPAIDYCESRVSDSRPLPLHLRERERG